MQIVYLVCAEEYNYCNNDSVFSTKEKAEARANLLNKEYRTTEYIVKPFSLDDEDCDIAKQGYFKFSVTLTKEGGTERVNKSRIIFDGDITSLPHIEVWDSSDKMMNAYLLNEGKPIPTFIEVEVAAKSRTQAIAVAQKARKFLLGIKALSEPAFKLFKSLPNYETWRRLLNANP